MGFFNSLIKSILGIDLDAIKKENESLKNSLSEEQEASKRKDIRLSQLEAETKSLKREVANLKSRKTLLEGDVSSLKHKLAESRGDSTQEDEEYRYTIAKIETWRIQNEEAVGEIEKLRSELISAHKEYEVVTKKLAALQKRFDSTKAQLDSLQEGQSTDIATLMSERKRLSDRIAVLTSENKRLSEVIEIITGNKTKTEDKKADNETTQQIGIGEIVQSIQSNAREQSLKNQRLGEIISALQLPAKKLFSAILVCGDVHSLDNEKEIIAEECSHNKAIQELLRTNGAIEAFFDGYKWGFKYGSQVVIEAIYKDEPEIIGTNYKVCLDRKYGLIDKNGEYILNPKYYKIEVLPNESILYSDGEDWYLLGISDSLVEYNLNDEILSSILSDRYLIYNLKIRKNLYIGQKPIEFYFVDNQIFKLDKYSQTWSLWYSDEEKLFDQADIEVTTDNQLKLIKNGQVLYLSPDGTILEEGIIDEPEYLVQRPLPNGYFIVKLIDGYWGVVDDENNYAVLAQYDMISQINKKYLRFQSGEKWGVMTNDGDIVIDAKYNSIESYDDGSFTVTLNDPANSGKLLRQEIEV